MSCIPSPKATRSICAYLTALLSGVIVNLIKVENDVHIFLNISLQILQYKCKCLEFENYSPFTDTSKAIAYSAIPLIK